MTHTQVYIILGVGLFISGFGSLVIYKEFQHNFPFLQGRNVLSRRHHDIELQDANHIQSNLRDIDIDISSLPEYPQAMINHIPIRWDVYAPPRFSHLTVNTATGNTPPGYSQITDNFINCPLELNSWDFIHWLIFLSILIAFIIIRYLNPSQIQLKIIIKLSIYVILFILWYNTGNSTLITALIIPVSIDKISYNVDDTFYFDSNLIEINLYLWNKDEIEDLLKNEWQ